MAENTDKPYAVVILSDDNQKLEVVLGGYSEKRELKIGYLKLYAHALERGIIKPVPVERVNGQGFKVLTDLVIDRLL